jgi:hypothetical protein
VVRVGLTEPVLRQDSETVTHLLGQARVPHSVRTSGLLGRPLCMPLVVALLVPSVTAGERPLTARAPAANCATHVPVRGTPRWVLSTAERTSGASGACADSRVAQTNLFCSAARITKSALWRRASRRILLMLRASARGSGPGCLPDGRGTGFCALRPKFDDVPQDRIDEPPPRWARTHSPGDAIGDPQQGLVGTEAVLPHEGRL